MYTAVIEYKIIKFKVIAIYMTLFVVCLSWSQFSSIVKYSLLKRIFAKKDTRRPVFPSPVLHLFSLSATSLERSVGCSFSSYHTCAMLVCTTRQAMICSNAGRKWLYASRLSAQHALAKLRSGLLRLIYGSSWAMMWISNDSIFGLLSLKSLACILGQVYCLSQNASVMANELP